MPQAFSNFPPKISSKFNVREIAFGIFKFLQNSMSGKMPSAFSNFPPKISSKFNIKFLQNSTSRKMPSGFGIFKFLQSSMSVKMPSAFSKLSLKNVPQKIEIFKKCFGHYLGKKIQFVYSKNYFNPIKRFPTAAPQTQEVFSHSNQKISEKNKVFQKLVQPFQWKKIRVDVLRKLI